MALATLLLMVRALLRRKCGFVGAESSPDKSQRKMANLFRRLTLSSFNAREDASYGSSRHGSHQAVTSVPCRLTLEESTESQVSPQANTLSAPQNLRLVPIGQRAPRVPMATDRLSLHTIHLRQRL